MSSGMMRAQNIFAPWRSVLLKAVELMQLWLAGKIMALKLSGRRSEKVLQPCAMHTLNRSECDVQVADCEITEGRLCATVFVSAPTLLAWWQSGLARSSRSRQPHMDAPSPTRYSLRSKACQNTLL